MHMDNQSVKPASWILHQNLSITRSLHELFWLSWLAVLWLLLCIKICFHMEGIGEASDLRPCQTVPCAGTALSEFWPPLVNC